MRRVIGLATLLTGVLASVRVLLRHADDNRNVARLRRRYDLDEPTARSLYRSARQEGFGAAARRYLRRPSPGTDGDTADH